MLSVTYIKRKKHRLGKFPGFVFSVHREERHNPTRERRVTTESQQGHRSRSTAGKYQAVQEWREKSSRRFAFRFSSFELKTTPHPIRSCLLNCLLCKHNLPIQAGELWRLLFRLGFFFCLFRLLFGSFSRARIIRTEYNREVLYLPFYCYTAIILLYILYYPFTPFLFSPPSGLCYIVIYYITPEALFLFPRVYIDIILYISRLDTVFYLPPVDNVLLYYFPAVACLSLFPGVFAVDALEALRLGSLAGPCWGSFLALPPLWPFGVLPGLLWRARIVGAVAVFRQRVQKYTISEKRLVLCTPLYGAFFLFWVCFPLCAFLCVLCLDAFSVGMSIFDAGRFHLCILHSLPI